MMTVHRASATLVLPRRFSPPVSYRLRDWLRYLLKGERGATGTSLSTYVENETLDHWIGGEVAPDVATLYFALFTAAPSDDGGGTEVSGTDYAREGITNNLTNFPAASAGSKTNDTEVDFGTAGSGGWGTVTHVGIFDASSAGNLLLWGALDLSKIINENDGFKFEVDDLTFALD
jgi:hypothetical protein